MSSASGDSTANTNEPTPTEVVVDAPIRIATASASVSTTPADLLTSSENVNNENREKELALNSEAEQEATPTPDVQPCEDDYSQHITYNTLGVAIYTDPSNQAQYEFDNERNDWVAVTEVNRIEAVPSSDASTSSDPYENEHYRWCHETKQWLPKESVVAENEFYTFNASRNEWIPKAKSHVVSSTTSEDGQTLHTYADEDGVVFFWDTTKNAWFPKIDDDFMARYQMGYGNYEASDDDDDNEDDEVAVKEKTDEPIKEMAEIAELTADGSGSEKPTKKRKGQPQPAQWFDLDESKNTKVYVTGMPTDITEEEFVEIMSKYGMIFRDPNTNKMKTKLYTDRETGQLKGDGLCDYIRVESVDMALKLLDGSEVRGHKVHVERAKFQMRGEYNPSLKPKKKKQDKEKIKKMQEKLFDWRPEKMRGERSKHERTVIIKNLFAPELFEKEVHLIIDYQTNLREECSKCGTVRKVIVHDRHPDGVAQVTMGDADEADLVVQMMHKRLFGQRQLEATLWDGKTKYKIEETTAEKEKRLSNWDQFLVTDEQREEKKRAEIEDNIPKPVDSIPENVIAQDDEV